MSSQYKILSWNEGRKAVQEWKDNGEEVVFTNGCFDILHLGHVDYLEKSKELGTKLVVGLNTDASVRKLKGPERPMNNEQARGRILAALSCVDAVILFGEETPLELISAILPDVLVKGSDYTVETIIGADVVMNNGGTVKTINLVDGYSTTGLINKIKKNDA
jgi:rfaE bifunctional protein nucleotidyltransferase chain/domain